MPFRRLFWVYCWLLALGLVLGFYFGIVRATLVCVSLGGLGVSVVVSVACCFLWVALHA